MKRTISVLLALCLLFLCGCQTQPSVPETTTAEPEEVKLTKSNSFIYHDGAICFIGVSSFDKVSYPILRYDLETGTVTQIKTGIYPTRTTSGQWPELWHDGTNLYLYDDYDYRDHKLLRFSEDLTTAEVVWENTENIDVNLHGDYVYYIDSVVNESEQRWVNTLYRKNTNTQEVTVVYEDYPQFSSYTVTDQYIYVCHLVGRIDGEYISYLMRSPKDTIQFEKIDLPINPGSVNHADGGLYIQPFWANKYTVHFLSDADGTLTDLGIYYGGSWTPIGDQKIISRQSRYFSKTRSTSCKPLYLYDLKTGESEVLCDSVYRSIVLQNRYVCYWWADWQHHKWFVYDLETGETKLMYEETESEVFID